MVCNLTKSRLGGIGKGFAADIVAQVDRSGGRHGERGCGVVRVHQCAHPDARTRDTRRRRTVDGAVRVALLEQRRQDGDVEATIGLPPRVQRPTYHGQRVAVNDDGVTCRLVGAGDVAVVEEAAPP